MFCPTRKGFVPIVWVKFETGLSEEEKAAFGNLKTHKDRLAFVLDQPRIKSTDADGFFSGLKEPMYGNKSAKSSAAKREAGNVAFYEGRYSQALILYSLSVFQAPHNGPGSECLALAFANRSACLQKLGINQMALKDIHLAIEAGYPESKVFKLYERQAECFTAIGLYSKSMTAYQKAHKLLAKTKLPQDKAKTLKENFANKFKAMKAKEKDEPKRDKLDVKFEEIALKEPNPLYPASHKGVEIRYEPHRGRYAVASEDITMGTTIVHERPRIFCLYPEKAGTNCQNCFKIVRAAIPCPRCTSVCFCSPECRDEAKFHEIECGLNAIMAETGLNCYGHLALRGVAMMGRKQLSQMREQLENRNEQSGVSRDQKEAYRSEDFINVLNLVALEEHVKDDDWLVRAFVASFILKLLEVKGYFKDVDAEQFRDEYLFTGRVLMQIMSVCPANSHDIAEFETPVLDKHTPAMNKTSLGAGLYSTLALFNHACNPDFMRCNRGNEVICVANRDIAKGEEICENYGLMYTMKSRTERQRVLKNHYKFDCVCRACNEDWECLANMKQDVMLDPNDENILRFKRFKCFHCGTNLAQKKPYLLKELNCLVCGKTTNLKDEKHLPLTQIKAASSDSISHFVNGRWSQGMLKAQECRGLVVKHLTVPMLELTEAEIAIWKCMWLNWGNLKKVQLNQL